MEVVWEELLKPLHEENENIENDKVTVAETKAYHSIGTNH